jgi:hypothetical protein
MTGLVVFAALLFWVGVFTVVFAAQGTTPVEFFLGRHEPLPADLGMWKELGVDERVQLLREERSLLPPGRASAGYLLYQVRYRDPETRAIVRVEPERRVSRRRTSVRSSR